MEQKLRQGTRPLILSSRRVNPAMFLGNRRALGVKSFSGVDMPPTFGWDNFEDIAIALTDKFPDTHPLTLRSTDMHISITDLPGFCGDPAASNESKLEAIQMAWDEEFRDRQA